MENYNKYLNFFGVTEENLRELLGIALSKGGEYADLFFEHSVINELTLRDGEVNASITCSAFAITSSFVNLISTQPFSCKYLVRSPSLLI